MNLRLGGHNSEIKEEEKKALDVQRSNEAQFDELKEDKKLRTANSKVFVLPNGDYRKVVYARDVHYYNEEEEAYRAIDNTFVPIVDESLNEITGYENRYNSCKIRLAAKLESKNLMNISKGKYNISWEIMDDAPVLNAVQSGLERIGKIRKLNRSSIARVKEVLKENKGISRGLSPDNLDGEVIYKDAFEKADLQYSVHSNAVKENIIIKEKGDEYVFAFKIAVKNLSVKLSESRQELLFCSENNEVVFKIPMPVMQDASGEASSEIYYDIDDSNEGGNTFVFKIIADSAWINAAERILPVTIDPMIQENDPFFNLQYAYKTNKNAISNGVGVYQNNNVISRLFIKLGMPDFGKNVIVNAVTLNMSTYEKVSETFKGLIVHQLSFDKDINSVAFDASYESKALDMVQFLPDNVASIDLTEYFENLFYKGKYTEQSPNFSNNGIVIRAIDEYGTSNNFVGFKNDFNLVFDYRVNSGMRRNQTYSTNELGRSGVSQVNLRTGSLTFAHESIKVEGNRFPVNIVNVYDSYAANGGYDLNGTPDKFYPKFATNGWKLSYQQFLIPETYVNGKGGYIQRFRYIDGEGTSHYLENKGSTDKNVVFADEDGLGLTLYCQTTDWGSEYTVYDSQKNKMIFNGGRLSKIVKRCGDETVIAFRNENDGSDIKFYQIESITINEDRKVKFNYNSYNLLTEISYKNEKIKYEYDYFKRLISITYPDGNKTEFAYTGNGALESVKDISGKQLTYGYKAAQPFIVERIEESSVYSSVNNNSVNSGYMKGDSLFIDYLSKNLVKTVDNKNIVTIYSFDSEGNATVVFENKNTDTRKMEPVSDINYSSRDQAHSISCNLPIGGISYAPNETYTLNANCPSDTKITFLPANLFTKGKTYVLSGFAKADSATINEEDIYGHARTFELTAVVAYNGSNYKSYHAKFDDKNTSWQMAATAFTVEEGLTGVTLFASYRNNINSAQFNNIRFVQCNAAITERKICLCNDPTKFFDAEDILKTTYKIKPEYDDEEEDIVSWPERSHTQKVKYSDIVKMLQDVRQNNIVTVRARDGKYLVSKAAAVKFTVKGFDETFNLSDLGIKNITFTETGTIEGEYNPYVGNSGTKFCPYDSVFSGDSTVFTFEDITGISYREIYGNKSETYDKTEYEITENDVVATIDSAWNSEKYIYCKNCQGRIDIGAKKQIYINTKNGSYLVTMIRMMHFSESRKIIRDGDKKYISTVRYDAYGQKIWEQDARGIKTIYEYDDYGNLIKTITLKEGEQIRLLTNYCYDSGDKLVSECGPEDIYERRYNYNIDNGLLEYSETAKGQRTDYSYNGSKNITGIKADVQEENGSVINRNTFSYNKDYITQVSHNGLNYEFTYSGLGEITGVSVGGRTILRSSVTHSASGDVETTVELNASGTMASNTVVNKDRYGRVKSVVRDGESIVENKYNGEYGSAKLTKTIDNCAGVVYNYEYDTDGEVNKVVYSGNRSGTISTEKDKKKRVTKQTHTFGDGTSFVYNYTYDDYPDERISSIGLSGKFTQTLEYTHLGKTAKVTLGTNGAFKMSESYSYYIRSYSAIETSYINFVNYGIGDRQETDGYEYDNNGNISKIITARGEVNYEYDGLNRLVQEINRITEKKYNYTYDAGGNLLTKKETSLYSQNVEKQIRYSYDYSNKDRLTGFGNESVYGYDAQGRPAVYRGWNLGWKNGRVQTFAKNGVTHTCEYDSNGIRYKKTANGLQHEYYLEDNKIVREVVKGANNYELQYMYGANGIVGFAYKRNGSTSNYYYRKNILGDIIEIYGTNGTKYAEYAYDAWGNCTVLENNSGIATLNPFRYRGYYWDSEFGLYYLNARYYDPEVGRFISQDDVSYLDPEHINGLNLYAYCTNNPVMMTDPDGNMPKWLKWLLGGLAFVAAVVLTAVTGGSLAPVFIGMGASILGEGLIEGTMSALNGDSFWEGFSEGAANGALFGGFSALGGAAIRTIKLFKNGVVIGESMTRVSGYAKTTGQVVYKGMPGYKIIRHFKGESFANKLAMAHNEKFVKRIMRWGVKITDIGINPMRQSRSWFYFMEAILTTGYKNLKIL